MKLPVFVSAILLAGNFLVAQNQENNNSPIIIQKNYLESSTSVPTFIKYDEDSAVPINQLNDLLKPYLKGKSELGLRLIKTESDNLGYIHYRYIQTFSGVDLEFAELMVHTKNGQIFSINGKLIDSYPNSATISLTEQSALNEALAHIGANSYKWEIAEEEAFIKRESGNEHASFFPKGEMVFVNPELNYTASNYKAAFRFSIYAHDPMSKTEIYISAENGEVLFQNQLIHTANVQGTATTAYSGVQTINTDSTSPGNYRLRQTVNGIGVNTYNLNLTNNYGSATDFTDTDNIWNNVNAQKDQYATDAHWGAEKTYEYFYSIHGRNSINNNGFELNSYIHASNPANGSVNYANAFWDGSRMTYGDGSGNTTPLVALDIAGHEISHGLTTFSANLVYASESGALNESFSDIFGAAIEFYARPNNANWLIGEDIGNAIRSLSNPRQYGDPDTRLGPSWQNVIGCAPSNQNDQCGVHGNSGVQNKWFYLLTVGGNGTNGIGNAYSVRGAGIDTAAAVAFRNLTVYLGRNSNYDDARFFGIQSAIDLYGACSPQVASVTDAWHAVGVGQAYVPYVLSDFTSSDTTNCNAPFNVVFTNNSINGQTFTWDFGDGTFSTARNINHIYLNKGVFDVKLITDGGTCGIDSIENNNYIRIDSTILCKAIINDGTNPTQFDCLGKIYDSGGSTGLYSDNETGTMTISPTGAATVTLNFLSFDVEAGSGGSICDYDNLQVFDGPNVNSPLIGTYCNSILPPATLTSTGNSVTLRFISDGGVTNQGFEINWSCNLPTNPPVPNFQADATKSCLGEISFEDQSTNAPNFWFWDFGDGNTSTQKDPTHTYATNGSYNVKLVASNGFGPDSITKNAIAIVNRPNGPTATDSTFCVNQSIDLNANGTGTIRWYTNQQGGTAIAIANNLVLPSVSKDTSFWAEDFQEAPLQNVGPANNTIGGGNIYNGDQHLVFDVLQPIELKRVTVYSGSGSTRAIELRDASGNVLQTKYIYIPSGTQFVNLNMEIQPGTDYQLGLTAGSATAMFRNNSGTSYPYTLPGMVNIKRSSASTNPTGFYYFFYDWKVKALDCLSPRVEVNAFFDPSCTTTSLDEKSRSVFQLYPNPTNNKLTISILDNKENLSVQILDITGKQIYNIVLNQIGNIKEEFNFEAFSEGVYFVKFTSSNRVETKQIVHIK